MAINDVLGLTVDISADTDRFVKDLQAAVKSANLDSNIGKKMVDKFKEAQADIKGIFAKTVAEAATAGFGRVSLDKFVKKLQPLTDDIETAMKRVFEAEVKIRKGGMTQAAKDQAEAALGIEKDKLRQLQFRLKYEKQATDKIIKRRQSALLEAERLAARTITEAGEEFGESIGKAFEDIKSGNVAGLLKGVGKRTGAHGVAMQEKGTAKGGMMGGLLKGIGSAMASIGPLLMAIGALAAGIAVLVGVFVGADAQAKKLNNTLLDSGSSAVELQEAFGDAGEGLRALREEFTNFDQNVLWGTTAKDTMEIVGAYGKAGITLRELTTSAANGADAMTKLRNATEATLTYAKLLGTTNIEMAEVFASRMEEMGQNINGVAENLSAVQMAAKESGFGVKRFFNMVLQATTGMTMYNVRMSEAAGLLLQLGKILGAKGGGEFLQGLTKGFGDQSTQEKYKRVMTTGAGRTKATFGRSAANTADDFLKKLSDKGMGAALGAALGKSGLKVDLKDSKQLVKDLGALSREDQTKLLASARMAGDDELVQQLTNLTMVAQGAKGGTGNMAMSLGGLDMGGKLMMQLQQGMAVLGKPLHELNLEQTMAFENMTGVQGEQLEQLRRVSQAMYGNHKALTDLSKNQERYAGLTGKQIAAEQMRQVKAYGAYVAENGDLIAAKLDDVKDADGNITQKVSEDGQKTLTKEIGSYIQSQGAVFAQAAQAAMSVDTQLAQEMVSATTELTKLMEQGVESWLQEIHGVVESILNFLSGGEKEARQTALDRLVKEMSSTREKIKAGEKEVAGKKAALLTDTTPAGKAKLQAEIDAKQADLKNLQIGYKAAQADRQRIARGSNLILGNRSASQLAGPQKGAAVSKDMAAKVSAEGAKVAVDAWLKHKFGTTNKEEYLAKQTQGSSGIRGAAKRAQAEDAWKAAAFFAQLHGGQAAVARAGGRQYQVSDEVRVPEKLTGLGGMVENALDTYTDFFGFENRTVTGNKRTPGQVYKGDTGEFGFRTPEALEDFRKVMSEANYDPIIEAARADQIEAERKQKELMGKGGEAPRAAAEAMEPIFARVLSQQQEAQAAIDLMNILDQAGISQSPAVVSGWVSDMQDQRMPAGLTKLLGKEAIPGTTGPGGEAVPGRTVQDLMREKGLLATGKPKADDFLMQIGAGGQVKFAQRINSADTVTAVASKGGGAVAGAARGAGGGTTLIQHNYSDMEAIKKGYRSMMQAKALG